MRIGVPCEIKPAERRTGMTPAGVRALVHHGHRVFVEAGAGAGSGFPDEAYAAAGATILDEADDMWAEAEMVVKVKEPIEPEFDRMKPGQILFTYLHLAADRELTRKLLERKVTGVAYETVQRNDGSLPLLAPMSEVAGRLSVQVGAFCLEAKNGGMGILLSGVSGVRPARVTVIGGGTAGLSAAVVAAGTGARVAILDNNPSRLRYLDHILDSRVVTIMSSDTSIEEECLESHLVIGAVLIPGAKAPKLIRRDLLRRMMPGSALVDIAVDQGGCCETTRPTTHESPTFVEEGVVHYCVANMPGAVPRTATLALTNTTVPYALAIADKGIEKALADDEALRRGLNVMDGRVWHPAVAETFDLPCEEAHI